MNKSQRAEMQVRAAALRRTLKAIGYYPNDAINARRVARAKAFYVKTLTARVRELKAVDLFPLYLMAEVLSEWRPLEKDKSKRRKAVGKGK